MSMSIAAIAVIVLAGAGAAIAASPTLTVLAPAKIATGSATVRATIAPGGAPTFYKVESGLTGQYSSQTPLRRLSSSTTAQTVTVLLSGLLPGTVYHYRFATLNK